MSIAVLYAIQLITNFTAYLTHKHTHTYTYIWVKQLIFCFCSLIPKEKHINVRLSVLGLSIANKPGRP